MKRVRGVRYAALASGAVLAATLSWAWAETPPSDQAAGVRAATQQAGTWLGALDVGHYDESWNGLATVMQAGTTQQEWTNDIREPREQLGKPDGRELQRAEFSTSVRGAPSGAYVTVTYLSHFSAVPPVLETVLLTLDDGRWRVAGYSVAPAPEASAPAAPDKAPGDAKPAS